MHVPAGAPKSGAMKWSPRYVGSVHQPTSVSPGAPSPAARQWFGTAFQASTPRVRQSSAKRWSMAGTVFGISPCVKARSSTASSGSGRA